MHMGSLGKTIGLVSASVAVMSLALPARADDTGAPRLGDTQHFTIDPVLDGVLVVGGIGFAALLDQILATGEIRPTVPGPTTNLLGIDRIAVTQSIDPHAATYSNIGLWTAYAYAVLDPILSGVRDGRQALLVDGIMYAESISLTWTMTSVTKIAVRRPRPIDYATCAASTTGSCTSNTDLQLSFYSGHVADVAAIAATASYLAFVRGGAHSPRPWLTLAAGTALTGFVAYMRVASGEHFPTDVMTAAIVGGGIGVLVPHFHRRPHYHGQELEAPPLWIGYAPAAGGGGALALGGMF